ncbi:hypothetical protein DZE40_004729 [Clostridium beijerinckii]|nr:hypothetical protein [Clostridium beijerinckii]
MTEASAENGDMNVKDDLANDAVIAINLPTGSN